DAARCTVRSAAGPSTLPTLPVPRLTAQGTPEGPTLAQRAPPVQHRPKLCGATLRLAAGCAGGEAGGGPRGAAPQHTPHRAASGAWSPVHARRSAAAWGGAPGV